MYFSCIGIRKYRLMWVVNFIQKPLWKLIVLIIEFIYKAIYHSFRIIMLAICVARIFLDDLISWMLDVKIGFGCWWIKEVDLTTEFYLSLSCVLFLLVYPWKPLKILALLRVNDIHCLLLVGSPSKDPWVLH